MTEFLVSILKVKNSTPQNMHSCLGVSVMRQAVATHSKQEKVSLFSDSQHRTLFISLTGSRRHLAL